MNQKELDQLCVNTIRTLSMDGVQKANSGHPGMPMGCAPMAYVLWTRFLKHNPKNPKWFDRDRFVLSAGHGSMLLYSLLHLTGYDLSLDDIKQFRQWDSKTPGHPEYGHTAGVETTTGPLGQGFANGVGMAMAAAHLAAKFNRDSQTVVNHRVYGIVSDGDLMEGISHEAASMAGHLGLGNLIYLYDDNKISIDGSTDLSFTENVQKRFEAYGWHTHMVEDGNDLDGIAAAIEAAIKEEDRPSLISIRTLIGYGSPNKQDTSGAHGSPLGDEEIRLTKENLNWPSQEPFFIPEEALAQFRSVVERGEAAEAQWNAVLGEYRKMHPDAAQEFDRALAGGLPEKLDLPEPGSKAIATRAASGLFLNAIADQVHSLIGGSADLTPSNNTYLKGSNDFQADHYGGRNLRFGVREHAMGSAMNGMALHGGVIPYGGTFLVFTDYMRPAMRLASLMGLRVVYIMTHDSIGLGEDGPTHQPVEHTMSLRLIPGLQVFRPGDEAETYAAWHAALHSSNRPSVLALTRQGLPPLKRDKLGALEGTAKGAYILADCEGTPEIILVGTGSETQLALSAQQSLVEKGVKARAVSMPCWELFFDQTQSYRDQVFPPQCQKRVAIEAGVSTGWERIIGSQGAVIGLDHYGASAPGEFLMEKFGFSHENVLATCEKLLKG